MQNTRQMKIGNIVIGGGAPVAVQSMTNTPTADYDATYRQVCALAQAGCDIVRVTLNHEAAVESFAKLCATSPVPIVADIHYNARLALAAVEAGASKVRINPGNISRVADLKELAKLCAKCGVGIRIGVNMGSLERAVVEEYGHTATAMVVSALDQAALLEGFGLHDICISVKSSDPKETFDAYRMLAESCDYPLHIGVTEAGGGERAIYKSFACMGGLLHLGIGDTLRVSLSDDPVEEVRAGIELLRAVGLRRDYVDVMGCPTCGRTTYDVVGISAALRQALASNKSPLKVAVMGCVVNGLGEAGDADIAVVGLTRDKVDIYVLGERRMTLSPDEVVEAVCGLIPTVEKQKEARNG